MSEGERRGTEKDIIIAWWSSAQTGISHLHLACRFLYKT